MNVLTVSPTAFPSASPLTRPLVVLDGPTASAADLLALRLEADSWHAEGFDVVTPADLGVRGSLAYARAAAEAMLAADALVLTPGWRDDADALASAEIADALGVATLAA